MKKKRNRRRDLVRGGVIPTGALEPLAPESDNGAGGLAINDRDVNVPSGVDDQGEERAWFRIGPLMGTIIVLAICWICVVAWMIKQG